MKLKPLVYMMAMVPAIFLPGTTALHASDLSIYKSNARGSASILLMLDTSGSMGISSLVLPRDNEYGSPGDVDASLCEPYGVTESGVSFKEWKYNAKDMRGGSTAVNPTYNTTAFRKTVNVNGQDIHYYLRGCGNATIDDNGKLVESNTGKFDRLSRLKDAVIQLLADQRLDNTVRVGLAHFSTKTDITVGTTTNKLVDGHSGKILVPVAELTPAHRADLIQALAGFESVDTTTRGDGSSSNSLKLTSTTYPNIFKASSGTPAAHAYAEAGAYMMGTTTGVYPRTLPARTTILYDGYSVIKNNNTGDQLYYVCVGLDGNTDSALGATSMYCDNQWNRGMDSRYPGKFYENNRPGDLVNIYKPHPTIRGEWVKIDPAQYKNQPEVQAHLQEKYGVTTSSINNVWTLHRSLPIGWRWGGWLKVANEPMDIEPIGAKVWDHHGSDTKNMVSYRSSPFSLESGNITVEKQGYLNCPSGFSVVSGSPALCDKSIPSNSRSRPATQEEKNKGKCLAPVVGGNPVSSVYDQNGQPTNTYTNNLSNTSYGGTSSNRTCTQTREFVARSWGTYTETVSGPLDNMVGGFMYADNKLKDGNNYKAGGITSECNGNGIYFLTDGAPNSTKDNMAQTIMNLTLGDSYGFTGKPSTNQLVSPRLQASVFDGETGGWEYIGEYARKLRNTAQNPASMAIKTAVVGFGSSFAGIPKNTDGTYQCEAIKDTNLDAYNACKWGSKDYGDGGFYYAEDAEDIANSIVDFVGKVSVSFEPSSMGTISVPRDPLDQTQMLGEGFFPMVVPLEAATVRTWIGNLKKYKIEDGTLKDASGNAIYTGSATSQSINKSAKDLWSNALSSDDHSSALSGGALNNIPVTSLMDQVGEFSKDSSRRNVFIVDFSGNATGIREVTKAVTKENLATDYSSIEGEPEALSVNITAEQRYALLNYLGYKTNYPPANLAITTAILREYNKPNVPYRFLGGVVHSTPLMVTKSAMIKDGENGTEKRDEYVVYGSFEGGLHIVDAGTGEEKSVFVPEEILRNQAETLANPDAVNGNGLAYGVDAPWALDSAYKVTTETKSDTTTTSYKATRLNIYGGLRMGGEALYGLNIENPSLPKLLFHITPSTSGFERMGQIWAKPTVTEILIKGERKRVLIFGGGYDADIYEKPADAFEKPTEATKGNVLYIVEADTGNLIASVSSNSNSSSTVVDNANDQSDEVKYSVVGQPVVRDYNADGLADMIYFADLGGQIFRVDLNNNAQFLSSASADVIVRTKRIANLATNTFTPRFYERLTTAVFNTDSGKLAVLVTAGSGNRSYPLEVENEPNRIYGILDYDAAMTGLEKSTYSSFLAEATAENLADRGILGVTRTSIEWGQGGTGEDDKFRAAMTPNGTLRGWMLQLANTGTGNVAKSMEESQLIAGDLYVNVYDPNASLSATGSNQCGGGVQGLSTIHRICAPYADCAAYVNKSYQGIVGPTLGKITGKDRTSRLIGPVRPESETCIGNCKPEGASELPEYSQKRTIKPTRWFEW